MYVTPILLLLLASNVFADGTEDWQALFSNMGINTKETSCMVQNFKVNLDTLMSLANKHEQNEVNPEGSGDDNTPELTPLAASCQTYYISNTLNSFWNADRSCQSAGMKIATPDTNAKLQCLRDQLRRGETTYNYWIGIRSEEPDLCLYIWAVDGSIHNTRCTTYLRYICERA